MTKPPPRLVLFVCTQNACRSQMAELWTRHLLAGQGVEAASAGTQPATPNPRMLAVMEEAGVDVSRARSDALADYDLADFDLVVTLCDAAAEACPVIPKPAVHEHHPFPDPARVEGEEEEVLEAFRSVRDSIRAFVLARLSSAE